MPTNDILTFALGPGQDVQDQPNYAAAIWPAKGMPAGISLPKRMNKVLRQSAFVSAALAKLVVDVTGNNVLDNNDVAGLAANLAAAFLASITPVDIEPGIFKQFAMAVPAGYLDPDGSVVSQVTYAGLYAAIGGAFNIGGEGAGNFRLPNLCGRTPIGLDTMITPAGRYVAATLAAFLGAERHQLLATEFPNHGHTSSETGHHHAMPTLKQFSGPNILPNTGPPGGSAGGGGGTPTGYKATLYTGGQTTLQNAPLVMSAAGGGDTPHNNVQPTLVLNWGIKT